MVKKAAPGRKTILFTILFYNNKYRKLKNLKKKEKEEALRELAGYYAIDIIICYNIIV